MKKRVDFLSQAFAMIFFTLMIIIDFFPQIGINMSVGVVGFGTFFLIIVIIRKKGEPVFSSNKQELIFIILFGIYFFSLLIILSLVGGVSQAGIGLTNPVLWGLYLIGVLASYTRYKKELKQLSNNGSGTYK